MYEHKELLTNSLSDYYEPPNNIRDKIIIKPGFDNKPGFPDNKYDAYKAKIDECGISGDLFEDPDFGNPESL